jgi:hypothetical protein
MVLLGNLKETEGGYVSMNRQEESSQEVMYPFGQLWDINEIVMMDMYQTDKLVETTEVEELEQTHDFNPQYL